MYTFADHTNVVKTINGLSVIPEYDFKSVPIPEILIIPGGNGSRNVIENHDVLKKLKILIEKSRYTFSVCSGARILAKTGILDQKKFATHYSVYDEVQRLAPTATACYGHRFTDNGKILTSAGVAAGIDLAFYLLEKLQGKSVANKTAEYMEYPLNTQMTGNRT